MKFFTNLFRRKEELKLINVDMKSESETSVTKSSKPAAGLNENIGNDEPFCPYCAFEFDKQPARKKKCPQCANFVYVRTRPKDSKKILIKESEIAIVEELWSIKNGTHDQLLANRNRFNETKRSLSEKNNFIPSDKDVFWAQYNEDLITHASNMKFGLYRNTRMNMGAQLKQESKTLPALHTYLEVFYLDVNGPSNVSADPELLKEYPPFDPKHAFIAPGIIREIEKLNKTLNYDDGTLFDVYTKVVVGLQEALHLKVGIDESFKDLLNELKELKAKFK